MLKFGGPIYQNFPYMAYNEQAEQKALLAINNAAYETALKILMDAYGTDILRFCDSLVKNESDAQDMLQNVFIQAHKNFASFKGESQIRTWLYTIARNRCLDLIKSKKRLNAHMDFVYDVPDSANEEACSRPDPFASKVIRDCLEKLSSNVRQAMLLRFQSDYSYEEAAKILQEKPGTIQARVSRALPTLKRCVEDNGVTL